MSGASSQATSRVILAVDDSSSMRQMVRYTLEGAGYKVVQAADGVEALDFARASGVDLVLTGVNIPRMDGITLVRELRALDTYKFTPMLVLSAYASKAVVAFQFYDKLSQRLGHVRYGLSTLALFVCDHAQARERDQWRRLFRTLRRLYRTEEERQIFEMMVEGKSAEETREHIHQSTASVQVAPAGEIELF